jgi:hypothetical protein
MGNTMSAEKRNRLQLQLYDAVALGNADAVATAQICRANINVRAMRRGGILLPAKVMAVLSSNEQLMGMLLSKREVNAAASCWHSCLELAVLADEAGAVAWLLHNGASPNRITAGTGHAPLGLARSARVMISLLKHGALFAPLSLPEQRKVACTLITSLRSRHLPHWLMNMLKSADNTPKSAAVGLLYRAAANRRICRPSDLPSNDYAPRSLLFLQEYHRQDAALYTELLMLSPHTAMQSSTAFKSCPWRETFGARVPISAYESMQYGALDDMLHSPVLCAVILGELLAAALCIREFRLWLRAVWMQCRVMAAAVGVAAVAVVADVAVAAAVLPPDDYFTQPAQPQADAVTSSSSSSKAQ